VNVYKYISSSSILETENGFTTNEPAMLALQQAIDKATYGLIMEGIELHLWNFADPKAGWPAQWRYQQERDGRLSAAQVAEAERRAHRGSTAAPVSASEPPPPPPPQPPAPSAALSRPPSLVQPTPLSLEDLLQGPTRPASSLGLASAQSDPGMPPVQRQ
jgi:curli production assembly/transport component CsgG